MHSNNFFFAPHRRDNMKPSDIDREVIVFISEHKGITKTVKGTITEIIDDDQFTVVDSHGIESRWNEKNIKGIKFLGDE